MTMKFTHTATFSNNLRTVMLPTGVLLLLEEEEEDFAYTLRFVAWELITLFGPLSRWGLNPIKPVYDPDRPAQFNSQRL